MNKRIVPVIIATAVLTFAVYKSDSAEKRVLVFSLTEGFRHASIADSHAAIAKLGSEYGFKVDSTENPALFNDEFLSSYDVVVFLNTSGDVLSESQQIAFQRFIQLGGGYVGVHAASDTEYAWSWYGQLVGGYFVSHPRIQEADLLVQDTSHVSTSHLPLIWTRTDEWYNLRMVNPDVNVLITIDETSYDTGLDTSKSHAMAWYQEFDGGRAFYTELGHTTESWSEEAFLHHLLGGIEWAMEGGSGALMTPNESQFERQILMENLREPMELAPLPDGRILFIERHGSVHLVNPATGTATVAAEINVFSEMEDGLLGLALDPEFEDNGWLYLYYSAPGSESRQHLSRFYFNGNSIELDTEIVLLVVPTQREECCHSGGSLEFGPDGSLYLSTGDDTNPFASDGFSPSDERQGRSAWDAQRTSANSRDYRGKILRIRPENDGTYSIPEGNLFADKDGYPEIYTMGNRNPFRISVDSKTGWLYWGEVGPDANEPEDGRGPAGHDEINQARTAGFFGWPYFLADNKVYFEYDFEQRRSLGVHNPDAPVNNSPNNTGTRDLAPAQPAWIWYPYGESPEFPQLESGGRTAMAGPVFRVTSSAGADGFPEYYEGKLFMYEWMRHRIYVVTMDSDGDYSYMESFLPSTTFSRPMDMAFSDQGSLLLLEYGEAWNSRNPGAQLSRIIFKK